MHSPENLLREALTLHSTYKSVVYVLLLLRDFSCRTNGNNRMQQAKT